MIIHKVKKMAQAHLNNLLTEFFNQYPKYDDNNIFPENSDILQITISPFDHWLSWEEAEKEIRGFSNNPTKEVQNKFHQHESLNLKFLNAYLKTREFFYVAMYHEVLDDDSIKYHKVFYKCNPENNFYHVDNGKISASNLFLPALNVFININDDYSIKFELLKKSEKEISSIINLAKIHGLYAKK